MARQMFVSLWCLQLHILHFIWVFLCFQPKLLWAIIPCESQSSLAESIWIPLGFLGVGEASYCKNDAEVARRSSPAFGHDSLQRITFQSELFCWELDPFESFRPLLLAVEIASRYIYCLSGCRFRSKKWRKTPKFKAFNFVSVCRAFLSNRIA